MRLTLREKRLISAMNAGFQIHHEDGHRWIMFEPYSEWSTIVEGKLEEHKIAFRNKVYGSYDDALDRIDGWMKLFGLDKLEDMYIDFGVVEND